MSLLCLINIYRVVQKGGWGRTSDSCCSAGSYGCAAATQPFWTSSDGLTDAHNHGRKRRKMSSSCSCQSVPTRASRSLEPWLRLARSHSSGGTWGLFPSKAEPSMLYHETQLALPSSWQFPHAGESTKECLGKQAETTGVSEIGSYHLH